MSPRTYIIALLALAGTSACHTDETPDDLAADALLDEELDALDGATGKTKGSGGVNGDYNFCDDPANPCVAGEGDCDADGECDVGLVCGVNNGAAWGFASNWDVCVASHCTNGVLDGDETAVDVGGSCSSVACSGSNGDKNGYCTRECPCTYGEGDCDRDNQCAGTLVCRANVGASFGMPSNWDNCMPPIIGVAAASAGDLIVTEIMQNPAIVADAEGEWFEIYNTSSNDIDINGMAVTDNGTNSFTVASSVIVPAGGYAVLAEEGDSGINGGVTADYDYPSTFVLGNTDDEIILTGSVELDRVEWDGGPSFPNPTGASMNLDPGSFDSVSNDAGGNWCLATTPFGDGDLGTPGSANVGC